MNGSLKVEYQVQFRPSAFVKFIGKITSEDAPLISECVQAPLMCRVRYPSNRVRIRRCVNKRSTPVRGDGSMKEKET